MRWDDIGQVYDRFFQGWIYQVRSDGKGNQLSKHPVAGFGKGSGKGPQLHTLIRYDMNHNGKPEYMRTWKGILPTHGMERDWNDDLER